MTARIIVRIQGGLGNQLFQYAAARRLALALGGEVKVDLNGLAAEGHRSYGLDRFRTCATLATPADIRPILGSVQSSGWRRRVWQLVNWRRGRVYREPHFHFDPRVLTLTGTQYLDGYWQSEKYFIDIASMLRAELELRDPPSIDSRRLSERMAQVASVCVHFRRGDYVTNPVVHRYHGVCPPAYYAAAVDRLLAIEPAPHFFVFSDDIAWAKANFAVAQPVAFIAHNGVEREHEDLWLMSQCRHHIIANSTFSWWGAWLGRGSQQQVFAPKRWFRGAAVEIGDLLPPAWHRVEVPDDQAAASRSA